jgi:hypothetical protein
VDNAHILSMLSLSQQYTEAGAAKSESFQALALVVGAARKWSHYSFLLTVGCWILLLFTLLFSASGWCHAGWRRAAWQAR